MTLDEAIKHAEEVAELNEWFEKECLESIQCKECAKEHRQLAEWLKELKQLREQEPFDIETYCREHFMVMVDKDVWEKAEKALKQEPTTHGYMLVCPNCGLDVHSDFKTCPRCGAKMKVGE